MYIPHVTQYNRLCFIASILPTPKHFLIENSKIEKKKKRVYFVLLF